jgi:hypothetical protein
LIVATDVLPHLVGMPDVDDMLDTPSHETQIFPSRQSALLKVGSPQRTRIRVWIEKTPAKERVTVVLTN